MIEQLKRRIYQELGVFIIYCSKGKHTPLGTKGSLRKMVLERPLQYMGFSLVIWGRVLLVAMENLIIIFKVSVLI